MPKILVIEDEKMVAELIQAKLEREGFEVHAALDGFQGLEDVSRVKPDLIILDVLLPGIDGFHIYKKIKANPVISEIPILVMTGRGAMRDTFEEAGVDTFLVKPFDPEELVSAVKKLLARHVKSERSGKVALIAGTDPEKLRVMRKQLRQEKYTVELASDGTEALDKALKLIPELFVVQFDMPGMDADHIIKILNEHPGGDKIQVVVYSLLEESGKIRRSAWGRFLRQDEKRQNRAPEAGIRVIDKFDSRSFLNKIKDFL